MYTLVVDLLRGLSLVVLLTLVTGCSDDGASDDAGPPAPTLPENDDNIETLRRLDDFTVLEHLGSMRVVLTRSRLRRVSIRGPASQHPHIAISVEGETLSLRCRRPDAMTSPNEDDGPPPIPLRCDLLTLFVSTDELGEIRHFGRGDLVTEGDIDVPALVVRAFSSGALELGIATEQFQLIHTGTGTVHLDGNTKFADVTQTSPVAIGGPWRAQNASVNISSSGDVQLEVMNELTAYLSSSGSVRLRGPASIRTTDVSTGRVLRLPFSTERP